MRKKEYFAPDVRYNHLYEYKIFIQIESLLPPPSTIFFTLKQFSFVYI